MTTQERRAVMVLASIFSLRLLGLFMLLPVLAIYTANLKGSTPILIGLALGVYGATQAILQIPFGLLSDRLGRKPVIVAGLLIFALGSVIAALADSITGVIIGRAIQGAGAVSSAVLALTADLTREEQRTKSMAVIGISIGFIFLLSLIIAPPLQYFIGVKGLFWFTAVLAGLAILLLSAVPTPHCVSVHRDVQPIFSQIKHILADTALLCLDFGVFTLHVVLTALFIVLPTLLQQKSGWSVEQHWKIYLPVLLLSVVVMIPFIMRSSKPKQLTRIYRLTIALLTSTLLLFAVTITDSFIWLLLILVLYFSAFNVLESMLPSLVSRVAPAAGKGTAIGIYHSAQFFGIFVGGVTGGILAGRYGTQWVILFCAGLTTLWLLVALMAPAFTLAESRTVSIGLRTADERNDLLMRVRKINGVEDVIIIEDEPIAYLKVNSESFNNEELVKILET